MLTDDRTSLRDRGRALEDDYFRKRDAEILARRQAECSERDSLERQVEEARELAAALGLDLDAVGSDVVAAVYALKDAGVTAESAAVADWLPALEVAWEGGMDGAERDRLLAIAAEDSSNDRARELLGEWCRRMPADRVFAAGRAVLRQRLQGLPPGDRAALRDRILAACAATAVAAAGWTGLRRVSMAEQRVMERVRAELADR